tara:strand:- start:168 stop:809 length:642 start_codon:yes stop_codon:yes gene_type:complete
MFKENKFKVLKKVLNEEVLEIAFNYLLIKKQCFNTLRDKNFISEFDESYGSIDTQVPGAWSCYSDIFMETLLLKLKPLIEKQTKLKLQETYSYCRFYVKGNELTSHIDRESCEISATLNLGGDPWPIHFQYPNTEKKVTVDLKPGDLIVYRGSELIHWRDPFEKEECAQVFLHYNDMNSTQYSNLKCDTRLHVGLPTYTKKDAIYKRELKNGN